MKKKIAAILCVVMLVGVLSGCGSDVESVEKETSMFIEIERYGNWEVVYHKETKVMYAVGYGRGIFTLLVNPDGSPMIYNG